MRIGEKNIAIILSLIVAFAIFIRLLPSLLYGAWGNDLGIYYYIVKKMVESKHIFISYTGWGSSYNLFPILYIFAILTHALLGIDILKALLFVGPIFGGGCSLLIYLIAREINVPKNVALLSSIILAVMPVHAYQTSHSAPLSVGHFFFLLSILFYIKSHKSRKWIPPLLFSTLLLILSHHLTTYMYLITILAITIWKNLINGKNEKESILYLLYASTLTFLYWGFIATPVYHNFMKGNVFGYTLNSIHIIAMWYFLLFIIAFLSMKEWKIPYKIKIKASNGMLFIFGFAIAILSALIGQLFRIHTLTLQFLLWSIPTALSVGFATIGWFNSKDEYTHPWLLAIIISLFASFFFNFHSLIPERHIEYMCEPLSIFASYGIVASISKIKLPFKIHLPRHAPTGVVVGVLIVANAVSIYPMGEHAANIGEGIPDVTLNAINWMMGNVSKNLSIATDHRIGMLLFANGFNTTYDRLGKTWYPHKIWMAESWENCSDELNGIQENQSYGRIYYVVIDDIMEKYGVFTGKGETIELKNESIEKFEKEPFILIYRNCSYKGTPPPKINDTIDYMDRHNETFMKNVLHWVEVYKIDWKYIENETNIAGIN